MIGCFERHHYAHHWIGVRMGLDALAEKGELDAIRYLDMREMAQGWESPDGLRYLPEGVEAFHKELLDFSPDITLICTADAFNAKTLDLLHEIGSFVALWFCDMREPEPAAQPLTDHLHLVMMTAGGMIPKALQAWGLEDDRGVWMFQACLPMKEMQHVGKMPLTDVVHVGSSQAPRWHKERRAIFDALDEQDDLSVTMIDPHTDREKAMVTAELPTIYQRSRISLGVSHADCYGYHSNRLMLATGNGGFYFCNHFPNIEALFEPGAEVVTFDLKQSALVTIGQMREWVDNRAERQKIRAAGFKRAQQCHTYPTRMAEVWKEIKARF